MVLVGVFGAIVGLAVGLLGAGGSILAIPALRVCPPSWAEPRPGV